MERRKQKGGGIEIFRQKHCKIYQFLAVILLSGCTTSYVPVECPKPVVQESLLAYCPNLPKLKVKDYTQGDTVDFLSSWIKLYKECQLKHQALVDYIRNRK